MIAARLTILIIFGALLGACAKEAPPRSVSEFIDNPLLLEAALVRCTQNRAETRYEAECVNVREAVNLIEAKEEAARRTELEEQSRRKRNALRRTQQAAAEARRRAAAARQRQQETEYLAQFGEAPPDESSDNQGLSGNLPGAVLPDPGQDAENQYDEPISTYAADTHVDTTPAAGNDVPVAEPEPEPEIEEEEPADLTSIRDELRRRNDADEN